MSKSRDRRDASSLRNTYCSRRHIHPPWNTTGVLRIAKCESVCGFCQKETKTAANLRKHVAIHIKNEGLSLSIAEGSSGRGRLELPPTELEHQHASPIAAASTPTTDPLSAPAILLSMTAPPQPPLLAPSYATVPPSTLSPIPATTPETITTEKTLSFFHPQDVFSPNQVSANTVPDIMIHRHQKDPFWALRTHNLSIKPAWTAIPASEGFKIMDYCKRNSVITNSSGPTVSQNPMGVTGGEGMEGVERERLPCYNRKTLFDEEWQAHMRDAHGVFLLWPKTWMRRIEVLDLDAFGGDIGVCNDIIMAG